MLSGLYPREKRPGVKGRYMKKEYDFSKAKLHKGPIVAPAKGKKIQKTFRLDEDVFEWLVSEAKKTGIPYQTLMNSYLKQMMNQEESLLERVEKIEAKLNLKKSG
jgi:uncharacterized protein (DUF4415 family)